MTDWKEIEGLVGNGADDESIYTREVNGKHVLVWSCLEGVAGIVLPEAIPQDALNEKEAAEEQAVCGDDYEIIITVKDSEGFKTVSIDSFGDAYQRGEDLDLVEYFVEMEDISDVRPEFEGAFELFYLA